MSPTQKPRKVQSSTGRSIPRPFSQAPKRTFAQVIADALRRDFGSSSPSAVKIVAGLTSANERAVKNWFLAKNGPTGKNLVELMRASDEVLEAVLVMSGRGELVVAKKLADSKQLLIRMLGLIDELQRQPISEPRDVIYAAFCSGSIKHPKKSDPASGSRWMGPALCTHLTDAVMLELTSNGFDIVRRPD
jgi:hypothetical protein